ncbi:MAG: AIR synthase-related protein, partial [Waterburya sp.]
SWTISPIFNWLAEAGNVSETAMFNTFNMGIGFVVIVPVNQAKSTLNWFKSQSIAAFQIGQVVAGDGQLLFV